MNQAQSISVQKGIPTEEAGFLRRTTRSCPVAEKEIELGGFELIK
jgi:hypothetical protein